MNYYLLCVWTGPSPVKEIAASMREAGIFVLIEGTEKIFLYMDGSSPEAAAWNVLALLNKKHQKDFGLKPFVVREITPEKYMTAHKRMKDSCPPTLKNDR